ncbi:MAG: hypothetical protein Q4G52_08235 [Clostridia bacterium]|nr:hypothetical protein [Clostridia bacterium]
MACTLSRCPAVSSSSSSSCAWPETMVSGVLRSWASAANARLRCCSMPHSCSSDAASERRSSSIAPSVPASSLTRTRAFSGWSSRLSAIMRVASVRHAASARRMRTYRPVFTAATSRAESSSASRTLS